MKKNLILLLISLISTAIIDVSFAFSNLLLSSVISLLTFSLVGFIFNERIKENFLINSLLTFSFLIVLLTLAFIVNQKAGIQWITVFVCSISAFIFGLKIKSLIRNKTI